jgi:hypothetical protein
MTVSMPLIAAFFSGRAEQDDVAIERVAPRGEQSHGDGGRASAPFVVDRASPYR